MTERLLDFANKKQQKKGNKMTAAMFIIALPFIIFFIVGFGAILLEGLDKLVGWIEALPELLVKPIIKDIQKK